MIVMPAPTFFASARRFPRSAWLLPVLLAACAPQTTYREDVRSIPISGEPLTTDPPYVLEKLVPLMSVTRGCQEMPTGVAVALVSKSNDIRTNADGSGLVSGSAKESWKFQACGKTIPMFVTYTFMPDGKTLYTFSAK